MTTAARVLREIDGHAELRKADLGAQQALYQQHAEQIWSPERLVEGAVS